VTNHAIAEPVNALRRAPMLHLIGIALVAMGVAIVFIAQAHPARRSILEDWGAAMALVGLVVWAFGFRLV
jgi:drug/metabolite transporter (DMT)-like permease